MTIKTVVLDPVTKVILVLEQGAVPDGFVVQGSFDHDAAYDNLGDHEGHTIYGHIRDVLARNGREDMWRYDIRLDPTSINSVEFTDTGQVFPVKSKVGERLWASPATCKPSTGKILGVRWLLNGTAISTNTWVEPKQEGILVLETIAMTPSGTVNVSQSAESIIQTADGQDPDFKPTNKTLPVISGTVEVGQVLTVSNGTWGNDPLSFAYQWYRDGVAIAGAINFARVPTSNDIGKKLKVAVTAYNAAGSTTVYTAETIFVVDAPHPLPVNTDPPVISGTLSVGNELTVSNGTWNNGPVTFAYQWRRNGVNISGETQNTYTTTIDDKDQLITCRVLASNADGSTAIVTVGVTIVASAVVITGGPFFAHIGDIVNFGFAVTGGSIKITSGESDLTDVGLALNGATGAFSGTI